MESKKRKQSAQAGPRRRSSRTRHTENTDDINDLRKEAIEKNEIINNEFKSSLNELKTKLNQAEYDLLNSDNFIKEHCREISRQIQLAKETKMQQIEEISDEMLKRVQDFESKTSIQLNKTENKKKLETELKQIKIENEKWNKKLDDYKVDDLLLNEAKESISKFTFKREKINKLLFKDLLEFKPNNDQINLGTLSTVIVDSLSHEINISEHIGELIASYDVAFNYLNDEDDFDWDNSWEDPNDSIDVKFICHLCSQFNDGGLFLYGEIKDDWVNTYDIILMVIDLETNIIKATKKLFIDLESIQTVSDKLCIAYTKIDYPEEYDSDEHDNDEFEKDHAALLHSDYLYLVLNKNLEKIHGLKTKKDLALTDASDENLFSVKKDGKVCIYNWQFQLLSSIGQKIDPKLEFYFPFGSDDSDDIKFFHLMNKYYFTAFTTRIGKHIRVVDASTGKLIKIYFLEDNLISVDNNCNLILKNLEKKSLCYLDSNGCLLKNIKAENMIKNDWFLDHKQTLCCFDKKNFIYCYQKKLDEKNYKVL